MKGQPYGWPFFIDSSLITDIYHTNLCYMIVIIKLVLTIFVVE